jgi:hypothetical protein
VGKAWISERRRSAPDDSERIGMVYRPMSKSQKMGIHGSKYSEANKSISINVFAIMGSMPEHFPQDTCIVRNREFRLTSESKSTFFVFLCLSAKIPDVLFITQTKFKPKQYSCQMPISSSIGLPGICVLQVSFLFRFQSQGDDTRQDLTNAQEDEPMAVGSKHGSAEIERAVLKLCDMSVSICSGYLFS